MTRSDDQHAPAIGCGCRAKPVLAQLESEPLVSQAWLHRSGTTLAVVLAFPTDAAIKTKLVGAALEKENFVAGAPLNNAHSVRPCSKIFPRT